MASINRATFSDRTKISRQKSQRSLAVKSFFFLYSLPFPMEPRCFARRRKKSPKSTSSSVSGTFPKSPSVVRPSNFKIASEYVEQGCGVPPGCQLIVLEDDDKARSKRRRGRREKKYSSRFWFFVSDRWFLSLTALLAFRERNDDVRYFSIIQWAKARSRLSYRESQNDIVRKNSALSIKRSSWSFDQSFNRELIDLGIIGTL